MGQDSKIVSYETLLRPLGEWVGLELSVSPARLWPHACVNGSLVNGYISPVGARLEAGGFPTGAPAYLAPDGAVAGRLSLMAWVGAERPVIADLVAATRSQLVDVVVLDVPRNKTLAAHSATPVLLKAKLGLLFFREVSALSRRQARPSSLGGPCGMQGKGSAPALSSSQCASAPYAHPDTIRIRAGWLPVGSRDPCRSSA